MEFRPDKGDPSNVPEENCKEWLNSLIIHMKYASQLER